MSYYNRYKNKKRQNGGGNGNGSGNNYNKNGPDSNDPNSLGLLGNQPADAIFDLGKNKRVTVRQFRNINLIDIREYYMDNASGEMRPGKKGISLTEDLYDELLKHRLNIDDALRRFGSRRPRTKTVRLLSDDEDEDDDTETTTTTTTTNNNNDSKDEKKKNETGKSTDESKSKKRNRDNKGEEIEVKTRKQKVAPPTLLLHEETIANAEREANATLVFPSLPKKDTTNDDKVVTTETKTEESVPQLAAQEKKEVPAATETETENAAGVITADAITKSAPQDSANHNNSSDGESLEAEMNKIFDEESEEE